MSALLSNPDPGDIIQPWSKPNDSLAPEELNTPDPTSFPDDILAYLTTTIKEARLIYNVDLATHVTPQMQAACPAIMELLQFALFHLVGIGAEAESGRKILRLKKILLKRCGCLI